MTEKTDTFTYEYVDPLDSTNLDFWIKIEHIARYLFARDFLSKKADSCHLDLGCGTGYGMFELAAVANKLFGIDYNHDALEKARKNLQKATVRFELVRADLDKQSLENVLPPAINEQLFDSSTAFEFFEHLNEPYRVLRELRNCIKTDGILLCSIPNSNYETIDDLGHPKSPYHDKVFHPGEFPLLLKDAGFHVLNTLGQGWVNRLFKMEKKLLRERKIKERPSSNPLLHDYKILRELAFMLAYPTEDEIDYTYSFIYVSRAF